jgi:hypothetical protein
MNATLLRRLSCHKLVVIASNCFPSHLPDGGQCIIAENLLFRLGAGTFGRTALLVFAARRTFRVTAVVGSLE